MRAAESTGSAKVLHGPAAESALRLILCANGDLLMYRLQELAYLRLRRRERCLDPALGCTLLAQVEMSYL
jgi:hypothetical protein